MNVRLHWGVAIGAVYTLFAASTIGFVAFAISQPVDLVSADYYARSLDHDARLAATARARALGPSLTCRRSTDGRAIVIDLPGDLAREVSGAVRLYRPSDGRADRTTDLRVDADGRQRIPIDGLTRGRWTLQLEWRAQGLAYYHEQSLDLR